MLVQQKVGESLLKTPKPLIFDFKDAYEENRKVL